MNKTNAKTEAPYISRQVRGISCACLLYTSGRTDSAAPLTCLRTLDGREKVDGCACQNVYGTYVHGLFDREESVQGLITALCAAKGLDADAVTAFDAASHRQAQYDLLANAAREHLNMKKIYRILEEGI